MLDRFLSNIRPMRMPSIAPQQQEQQEQMTPVLPPVATLNQAELTQPRSRASMIIASASAWLTFRAWYFWPCSSQNSAVVLPTAMHTLGARHGSSLLRRHGQSMTAMNSGSFSIILYTTLF